MPASRHGSYKKSNQWVAFLFFTLHSHSQENWLTINEASPFSRPCWESSGRCSKRTNTKNTWSSHHSSNNPPHKAMETDAGKKTISGILLWILTPHGLTPTSRCCSSDMHGKDVAHVLKHVWNSSLGPDPRCMTTSGEESQIQLKAITTKPLKNSVQVDQHMCINSIQNRTK